MVQLGFPAHVVEFVWPDPSRCFLCPPPVLALNTGTTGGVTDPGLELGLVTLWLDILARNFGMILGSWLLLELTVWDGSNRGLLILHDVCDVAGSWSAVPCLCLAELDRTVVLGQRTVSAGVVSGVKGFGLAASLNWVEILLCWMLPGCDWMDGVWEQL